MRTGVPIPFLMSHLQRDARGYPIPFMVYVDDAGTPHFAVNEEERRQRVIQRRLCGICGLQLTRFKWLVGGPLSAFDPHGSYLDPPMHGECARYALQVCPYLAAPSYAREIGLAKVQQHDAHHDDHRVFVDPTAIPGRPDVFVAVLFDREEWTAHPEFERLVGYIKPVRPFHRVEFWRHGERLDFDPPEWAEAAKRCRVSAEK